MEKQTAPDLAKYIDSVSYNLEGPVPIFLEEVDTLLLQLVSGLDRPGNVHSARMFALAFGSLRSGILLCLSGATSQVPSVIRHGLEAGAYGALFAKNQEFLNHWIERESNKSAKQKFRREGLKRAKELILRENPSLHRRFGDQIDTLISFGAHPNVFQVADMITSEFDEGTGLGIENITLLSDQQARNAAYLHIVPAYINTAELFGLVWPTRFSLMLGPEKIISGLRSFEEYQKLNGFGRYA